MNYLVVALGGAVGAMLRYGMSGWVQAVTGLLLPVGTLTVNILGSFIIGAVMEATKGRFLIPDEVRLLLTTGFCGALTTFSTFSYETLALMEQQQWWAAGLNTVLNVVVCLIATTLGVLLVRYI